VGAQGPRSGCNEAEGSLQGRETSVNTPSYRWHRAAHSHTGTFLPQEGLSVTSWPCKVTGVRPCCCVTVKRTPSP
jgi:hypothetical protein